MTRSIISTLFLISIILFSCEDPTHTPELKFISPAENAEFGKGDIVSVTIAATDDLYDINGISLYVNGSYVGYESEDEVTFEWDSKDAELGEQTLKARVYNSEQEKKELEMTILIVGSTPRCITNDVTDIKYTSAIFNGKIESDGGYSLSQWGFCWNSSGNPTIEDNMSTDNNYWNFTYTAETLLPNETYYLRTYATNSKGTFYGNEVVFSTDAIALVEGGTFMMGSDTTSADESPMHSVTLGSYYISKREVTNSEYCKFMNIVGVDEDGCIDNICYISVEKSDCDIIYNDNDDIEAFVCVEGTENKPASYLTWYGASQYCSWAGGRLPTEAEWEFAAKGGILSNNTAFSGSTNIEDVAWYSNNSDDEAKNIGAKNANELGIYDMSGNVWEWCSDYYAEDYYSNSISDDPKGPETGTHRVIRGGSFSSFDDNCTVSNRNFYKMEITRKYIGFRLANDL